MATTKTRRINLNTATMSTRASIIGGTVTVKLYDSTRTGRIERIEGGRAIVRFADGGWAYSSTNITVR